MREREAKKAEKKRRLSQTDGHKKKATDMKKKPAARTVEELMEWRRRSKFF